MSADEGARILEGLHGRGIRPHTLITPEGTVFTLGQRVVWKLDGPWTKAVTITEFDPRRGLTDGLTIKIENDDKDSAWVHPGWIKAEEGSA